MPTPRPRSAAQHGEQPRHLVGRQAGGRLVEHEDLGLDGQRPGDRDQRLLGARQAADARVRIDVARRPAASAVARRAARPAASRSGRARRGIAQRQRHVLGHRHPLDQAEVLVDEGDRLPLAGDGRTMR